MAVFSTHRTFARLVLALLVAGGAHGVRPEAGAAQLPSLSADDLALDFQLRVKQLGQFIDRFNNEDEELTLLFQGFEGRGLTRRAALRTLAGPNLDPALVERFVGEVVQERRYLSQADPAWYAAAACGVTYGGAREELVLILRKEIDPRQGARWVLVGAGGPLLHLSRRDTTRFVNPVSHEMNFIDLYRAFEDDGNALAYTADDFAPDGLSVLLYLMDRGDLTFEGVEQLRFHFLQIDGWILRVEQLNRPDHPGGWVITDLIEAITEEKDAYRRQILHLH